MLQAVEAGAHAEDELAHTAPPAPADRSFAWSVVFGVLRHRPHVDAALRVHLSRPLESLEAPVRAVLRAGAWERLYGRAAAYAVVDQAVEVLRQLGAGRAAGLVNAVLRKVSTPEGLSRAEALDHPAWLVARWDRRYGPEATEAWCLANGEPPPLSLAARDDADVLAARLREAGLQVEPARAQGEPVPGLVRVFDASGRVEGLPGFTDGAFWVQDAASAWMTDLVPATASRVLDACAAPGGKTFRLAARGAQVTATDLDPVRLERLVDGLTRLRLRADVRQADWEAGPHDALGTFDAVIVDAPCTALGTVRRHPEIRWRRAPGDPAHAALRQSVILGHAAARVAPGGALVYVVCSPEPEEGEEVVASFLDAHPDFVLDLVRTTAPPRDGEDAFVGARMIRR